MLVLRRRQGQSIQVNCTKVRVLEVRGNSVQLGLDGDDLVTRTELLSSDLPAPAALPLYASDLDEAPA